MKLSYQRVVFLVLFSTVITTAQSQPAADPYKLVLDRLQAITSMPLDGWRMVQADLPHGETPGASTAEAKPLALKQNLQLPVWLYENVEIPPTLNGYSLAGSHVALDLQ